MILNGLKVRILCVYIPPNSSKSLIVVSNIIKLIRHLIQKKFPVYTLADFNLPNIDWNIPDTTYNDCHISFTKFCSDNLFTQLIDSPTHKDGYILDLLLCDCMGLDRVKFHSVDWPLIDANDHSVISFCVSIDRGTKPTTRSIYLDFYRENFVNISKFLSDIIEKLKITTQKTYKNFMTNLKTH